MIRIERYTADRADAWNRFVAAAKNGHFLFDRRYMGYHADRFADASLMFYEGDTLIAVLPANASNDVLSSHQGLTFGGLVVQDGSASTPRMLALLDATLGHARLDGRKRLIYKALPHIYHQQPAEEDLYALFRHGARIERVDISTCIDLRARGRVSSRRTRGAKKARAAGVVVSPSNRWVDFWPILDERLSAKFATRPVHTVDEIAMLAARWPDNIVLYLATQNGSTLGGVVMYFTARVAHAQYICASDAGLELGALDLIFEELIGHCESVVRYFDFGISTEQAGTHLNEGLILQKEGFGGSGIVHVTYAIDL